MKAKPRSLSDAYQMHYRNWSTAKDVAEDSTKDLADVVKQALEALDVAGPSLALAYKWQRMLSEHPEKVWKQIRTLKRLCLHLGLVDERFEPMDPQMDLEDTIANSKESVI